MPTNTFPIKPSTDYAEKLAIRMSNHLFPVIWVLFAFKMSDLTFCSRQFWSLSSMGFFRNEPIVFTKDRLLQEVMPRILMTLSHLDIAHFRFACGLFQLTYLNKKFVGWKIFSNNASERAWPIDY